MKAALAFLPSACSVVARPPFGHPASSASLQLAPPLRLTASYPFNLDKQQAAEQLQGIAIYARHRTVQLYLFIPDSCREVAAIPGDLRELLGAAEGA